MTEMELRNLALVRAAAAERQMMRCQRPSSVVLPAFYSTSASQNHSVTQEPFVGMPDRCRPGLLPAQSSSLPVYQPVTPASSDFTVTTDIKLDENPGSDDVGGRIPVLHSRTRTTLTGSRSTTPVKSGINSFSIDSLLGKHDSSEKQSVGTTEGQKPVDDRVLASAEVREGTTRPPTAVHRPVTGQGHVHPAYFVNAPVPVPGYIPRRELTTWF